MKNFATTLFTVAFVLVFSLACKKSNDDAPAPSPNTDPTLHDRVEKKWDVTPPATGRIAEGSSDYTSFEFTDEGKYFIIKADKSQLKGNFTLNVGDSILTLDGLGTIYIDEITETKITFRLVWAGSSDENTIKAEPASTLSTSNGTGELVGSWSIKKRTINGVAQTAFDEAFSTGGSYMHVTLTNYGTYSIETNVPGTASKVGIWKWCTPAETTISTSNDPEIEPACTPNSVAIVSFKDGNLVLTNVFNSQTLVDTYVPKPE